MKHKEKIPTENVLNSKNVFLFHCGSFFAMWRVKCNCSFPATKPRRILRSFCCLSPLAQRLPCASPLIVLCNKKKRTKNKSPSHLACVRLSGTTAAPQTHLWVHTLVFCTDRLVSAPCCTVSAPFFSFFNIHEIIYQSFFQDIRNAARICFCPVIVAPHCSSPVLMVPLWLFLVFLVNYTTLYSVADVTKWEKVDGSNTKHHFLTRLFQVKVFFGIWDWKRRKKKVLLFTMFWWMPIWCFSQTFAKTGGEQFCLCARIKGITFSIFQHGHGRGLTGLFEKRFSNVLQANVQNKKYH